jgi:hypothetical protein
LRFFAWRNGPDDRVGEFTETIITLFRPPPAANDIRQHFPSQGLAYQSSRAGLHRLAGLDRHPLAGNAHGIPALRSFVPDETVPRASSTPEAHLSFVRHIHLGEFVPRYRP